VIADDPFGIFHVGRTLVFPDDKAVFRQLLFIVIFVFCRRISAVVFIYVSAAAVSPGGGWGVGCSICDGA
jgi:hypothetical protein